MKRQQMLSVVYHRTLVPAGLAVVDHPSLATLSGITS